MNYYQEVFVVLYYLYITVLLSVESSWQIKFKVHIAAQTVHKRRFLDFIVLSINTMFIFVVVIVFDFIK